MTFSPPPPDADRMVGVAPADAARKVLRRFFGGKTPGDSHSPLPLANFQAAAVTRLLRILEERGGALLGDAVGLGKTHVAMAVIGHSVSTHVTPVLVITPASLRLQWTRPLRQLARSLGTELALPRIRPRCADPAIEWTSHARLSRGFVSSGRPRLVVVDEAHAFRNPATRRYRELASLSRNARVLLLTATPINNSLSDLYFLFRLFLGDGDLIDLGIPDLRTLLRRNVDDSLQDAEMLRTAVAALMVRRNRRALPSGAVSFAGLPRRDPPVAVRYDLETGWGPGRLEDLVGSLEALRLDVYRFGTSGHHAASALLRIALLKRLESSATAFAKSIRRVAAFLRECLVAIPDGKLPAAGIVDALSPDQSLLGQLLHRDIPATANASLLADSAAADLRRIADIRRIIRDSGHLDPKGSALLELLAGPLNGRPVLVFTEFHDTARHLHRMLSTRHRTGLITGRTAVLGNGRASRHSVIEAFAPIATGVRVAPDARVDVLVATDVLSEGLNLQDCADVVSFDLPWNPVRLVQRIGRIDRLGSPHNRIRVHNFLPDCGLDILLGLLERIRAKLETIRAAGDFDAPPLHHDDLLQEEVRTTLDRVANADPTLLSGLERQANAHDGIEDRVHALACAVNDRPPPTGPSGENPSPGGTDPSVAEGPWITELARPAGEADGWLVVMETRGLPRFLFVQSGRAVEDRARALEILADATRSDEPDRPALRLLEGPGAAGAIDIAVGYLERQANAPPPRQTPAGRAARLLLRRLREMPGGASAEDCRRADAMMAKLRTGSSWGSTVALERLIDAEIQQPSSGFAELADRLEAPLGQRSPLGGTGSDTGPGLRFVALFRLVPARELVLEPESC